MQPSAPIVFIGFDPSELEAGVVASASLRAQTVKYVDVRRLSLAHLVASGLYTRPTERRDGQLWDVLSNAPMSTEHAIARFWVPALTERQGWGLFVDGDVLFRDDVAKLLALADERYAIQVVQHPPQLGTAQKKAGHAQTLYQRKNWSSVMLWNCAHPAHDALTPDVLNTWPGRDLHRFAWLADELIGALPPRWNWLAKVSAPDPDPAIVHFTLGMPYLLDHRQDPYADEWFAAARRAGMNLEACA